MSNAKGLIHTARLYLVQEIKQLGYVVCNSGGVGVSPFQMLFVYSADTLHTIIYRLVVRVCSGFRVCAWLNQKDCVSLQLSKLNIKSRRNETRSVLVHAIVWPSLTALFSISTLYDTKLLK